MAAEPSDPPPPDIRSCTDPRTDPCHPGPASTAGRLIARATRIACGAPTGVFLIAFALICCAQTALAAPLNATTAAAAAGHVDPFTSGPEAVARRIKPSPILTTLGFAVRWLATTLADAAGYELVPSGTATSVQRLLAKRLTQTQKVEAGMIPLLVILSGVFAGLTLGYFSVDPTQLHVLSISGTPKQQKLARAILPVRKNSHLLLTTLILGNMIVNEALPEVSDPVFGGGIQTVVASTAMVVIFSEIIPQSICSRYGLQIGATMAWPVRVLTWIFFPIAYPIAKLLEYILGAHHGIIYRRAELRELIKMHAAGAEGGGDLDFDTVTMAQGALSLAQKTVKDAMTPIDNVFMLPIEAKLDYETLGEVVRSGHSRIPVYQMVEVPDIDLTAPSKGPPKTKMVKKVLGCLLVKQCVLLDPEDATPLAQVPINAIPTVPWNEPLTNMLNAFQEGRSHMAIVSRRGRKVENDPEDTESIMTAAAGGLRQRLMRKVAEIGHKSSDTESDTDTDEDVEAAKESGKKHRRKRSRGSSGSGGTSPTATSGGEPSAAEKIKAEAKEEQKKKDTDAAEKKKRSGLKDAAALKSQEQNVPADAALPQERVDMFFDGLEGAPLGIITLEDVLEELIGEEIYDEYDEQGGIRTPASAFVPREAALAARKAALDREKLRLAESTPLPATNDADLEPPAAAPAPRKSVVMPKIPLPKFSLGKRPASGPGKSRDVLDSAAATPSAAPTRQGTPKDASPTPAGPSTVPDAPVVASPGVLDVPDPMTRTASAPGIKGVAFVEPATAVPARLLPSASMPPAAPGAPAAAASGTATPTVSAPAAAGQPSTLLTEALLIERGRRRLAAASSAPVGQVPGVLRAASATGIPRAPSRQPTPPIAATLAAAGAGPAALSTAAAAAPGAGAAGGIMSPQPRRTPKFKSVPTPLTGTPAPSQDEIKGDKPA